MLSEYILLPTAKLVAPRSVRAGDAFYVSAPKGRRGGARPVNTVDVMQRIINRVVGRHRAFSDPLQASLLQRTPGGHSGGHHGDKHRGASEYEFQVSSTAAAIMRDPRPRPRSAGSAMR